MKFPVPIQLDDYEVFEHALAGIFRCYDAIVKERRGETHGSKTDSSWHRHVEGKLAEAVWAKYRNRYCGGIGKIFKPDFGDKTEIRQTDYPDGHLLIHENDHDDHWFILVTGSHGSYVIQGFIQAREGKRVGVWKALQPNRPCFCIRIDQLHRDTDEYFQPKPQTSGNFSPSAPSGGTPP